MNLSLPFLIAVGLLLAWPAASLKAQNAPTQPAEQKLRESLRNTMLQLRTSGKRQSRGPGCRRRSRRQSKGRSPIRSRRSPSSSRRIRPRRTRRRPISRPKSRSGRKANCRFARLAGEVAGRPQADHRHRQHQGSAARRSSSNKRSSSTGASPTSKRRTPACSRSPNDILTRYEKFGLGDALTAREPFTGITRVKLQSLFEDYQDKLVDQRIKPVDTSTAETKTTPAPDKAGKAESQRGQGQRAKGPSRDRIGVTGHLRPLPENANGSLPMTRRNTPHTTLPRAGFAHRGSARNDSVLAINGRPRLGEAGCRCRRVSPAP